MRTPLILNKSGKVVHLEKFQSDYTVRPVALIPGAEKGLLVQNIVERLDHECKENEIIEIEMDGKKITIKNNFWPCGDGKAASKCTGLLGIIILLLIFDFGPVFLVLQIQTSQSMNYLI